MPNFDNNGESDNDNEHQSRLSHCKSYFEKLDQNITEQTVVEIIAFLHDTWSVVRNECQKRLLILLSKFPQNATRKMVKDLTDRCKNSSTWQETHGSLLGLSALINVCDISDHQAIESVCLALLSHVSTPVRECCRLCMFKIQQRSRNQHNFVFKLIFLVNSLLKSNNGSSSTGSSESCTLTLDGILGCLTDSFQEFPNLIIQFDVPFTVTGFGAGGNKGSSSGASVRVNQPTVEFLDTVKLCMLHPASSVRQKAGQVLTMVLANLLFPTERSSAQTGDSGAGDSGDAVPPSDGRNSAFVSALVQYIVHSVLISSLQSTLPENWPLQEICLMVVEEALRGVLGARIKQLKDAAVAGDCEGGARGIQGVVPVGAQSVAQLIVFMRDSLCSVLCHRSFEVRRMATQLLPLLARVAVMLHWGCDCAIISGISVPVRDSPRVSFNVAEFDHCEADAAPDTAHETPLKSSRKSESQPSAASCDENLRKLSNAAWLSELVKQNQHLVEVVAAAAPSGEHSHPGENWSLEGRGRLFEVERRAEFQKDLRSVAAACTERGNSPWSLFRPIVATNCSAVLDVVADVLPLLESVYASGAGAAGSRDQALIVSNDCVECLALTLVFLSSTRGRLGLRLDDDLGDFSGFLARCDQYLSRANVLFASWTRHLCSVHLLGETAVCRSINLASVPVESTGSSSASISARYLSAARYITGPEGPADSSYGRSSDAEHAMTFIPSLSDPATDAAAYLPGGEDVPEGRSRSNSGCQSGPSTPRDYLPSTPRSVSSPMAPSTACSPFRLAGGASRGAVLGSSGYQSMNRWNCEAVSPLLHCLLRLPLTGEDATCLAVLLLEWVLASARNSLWLDGRAFSRRNLHEALAVLIPLSSNLCAGRSDFHVLLCRGVAQALYARQSPLCGDMRNLISLVRAANLSCGSVASESLVPDESRPLLCDAAALLAGSAEYFAQFCNKDTAEPPERRSSMGQSAFGVFNSPRDAAAAGGGASSSSRVFHLPLKDIDTDLGQGRDGQQQQQQEEDEFSDWDEDSDGDGGRASEHGSPVCGDSGKEGSSSVWLFSSMASGGELSKISLSDTLAAELALLREHSEQLRESAEQ